jgi:cysteine desulfurase / selenocysteine lyase
MIYLDNAATSHPKPADCLRRALDRYLELGASPGRGGYDAAMEAAEAVETVRRDLGRFFGGGPDYEVCFAYNATEALNTLLQGLARPGDHMVSTRLEHNSVLRPLTHLRDSRLVTFDLAPFNGQGFVEPDAVAAALRPETRLVLINHASNVMGTVQPVAEIGALCRERGIHLLLDVSQSAGQTPILAEQWGVSGLAFTGHKSLLGPTGIGGLMIRRDLDVQPSRWGGTGIDSQSLVHTRDLPHRLEAGTINLFGILALGETLGRLAELKQAGSFPREMELLALLRDGLAGLEGVTTYCAHSLDNHLPLLSCKIDGHRSGDVAVILDGDFEIAVRAGLHCAPLVHEDLGTGLAGAVRFSLGPYTTREDIEAAVRAMGEIASVL